MHVPSATFVLSPKISIVSKKIVDKLYKIEISCSPKLYSVQDVNLQRTAQERCFIH